MKITNTINKYKNKGFEVKKWSAKLVIALSLFLIPNLTFATTLDQQIQDMQTKVDQTKGQVSSLSQVVAAFDSQIGGLQSQINSTSQQISQTNNQIVQTESDLVTAQQNLDKARLQLSDIITTSYIDNQQSQIEVIAKSNNFSDFVNRSTYLESVQVKISDTAQQIVQLQLTLTAKKASLLADKKKNQDLMNSLSLQQSAIAGQRSAQAAILSQTKGSQAAYQQQLGSLVAYRKWLSTPPSTGGSGGSGTVSYSGTGGYPWAGLKQDSGSDTWGFYYRECTSYAAWRAALSGAISSGTLLDWGTHHSANGGEWLGLATTHGLSTTRAPRSGTVMVFPSSAVGGVGHVAFVDSVNGNGTIDFSDYNWNLDGTYRHVSGANPYSWPLSSVTYIYQN